MSNSDFESLLEDFELLESWEDRYRYIIDLGKDLDPYPEPFRTEEYRVLGCASQVWFYPSITKGEDETIFDFKGLMFMKQLYELGTIQDILNKIWYLSGFRFSSIFSAFSTTWNASK